MVERLKNALRGTVIHVSREGDGDNHADELEEILDQSGLTVTRLDGTGAVDLTIAGD